MVLKPGDPRPTPGEPTPTTPTPSTTTPYARETQVRNVPTQQPSGLTTEQYFSQQPQDVQDFVNRYPSEVPYTDIPLIERIYIARQRLGYPTEDIEQAVSYTRQQLDIQERDISKEEKLYQTILATPPGTTFKTKKGETLSKEEAVKIAEEIYQSWLKGKKTSGDWNPFYMWERPEVSAATWDLFIQGLQYEWAKLTNATPQQIQQELNEAVEAKEFRQNLIGDVLYQYDKLVEENTTWNKWAEFFAPEIITAATIVLPFAISKVATIVTPALRSFAVAHGISKIGPFTIGTIVKAGTIVAYGLPIGVTAISATQMYLESTEQLKELERRKPGLSDSEYQFEKENIKKNQYTAIGTIFLLGIQILTTYASAKLGQLSGAKYLEKPRVSWTGYEKGGQQYLTAQKYTGRIGTKIFGRYGPKATISRYTPYTPKGTEVVPYKPPTITLSPSKYTPYKSPTYTPPRTTIVKYTPKIYQSPTTKWTEIYGKPKVSKTPSRHPIVKQYPEPISKILPKPIVTKPRYPIVKDTPKVYTSPETKWTEIYKPKPSLTTETQFKTEMLQKGIIWNQEVGGWTTIDYTGTTPQPLPKALPIPKPSRPTITQTQTQAHLDLHDVYPVFTEPKVTTLQVTKTGVSPITWTEIYAKPTTLTYTKTSTLPLLWPLTKTRVSTKTLTKVKTLAITETKTKTLPLVLTLPLTKTKTKTLTQTKILTQTITQTITKTSMSTQVKPKAMLSRKDKVKIKKKLRPQGYNTYVKAKGRYLKVTPKPLPKTQALGKGAHYVDNTPSRTFYIKPAKKTTPVSSEPRYSGGMIVRAYKFRKPIRKGQEKKHDIRYIEKTPYLIDTPGEIKGITVKGLQKLEKMRLTPSKTKLWKTPQTLNRRKK